MAVSTLLNISLTDKDIFNNKGDALILFVEQGFDINKIKGISEKLGPNLSQMFEDRKFSGKSKSSIVISTVQGPYKYLVFLGLGKKNEDKILNIEKYRRLIGSLIRILPSYSIKSAVIDFNQLSLFLDNDLEQFVQQTTIMGQMASYVFNEFITDPSRIEEINTNLILIVPKDNLDNLKKVIKKGEIIADAVNTTREWVDLPSNMLKPEDLASNAHQIAQDYGLECTIFSEEEVNEMGMGGLSAVASGSERDCKLVILEYKYQSKNDKKAPTICFVGKGITFDSGGLSLKPALHMETMKEDMSGAAAVIGTMKALAQLKPKVNIIAIAPITENMPSGAAVKPGDIVRFYNGKTAEIKNTDAEGRLILADALSYAVKHYKPDAIIDLATLTGACAYALGPYFSGMFGEDEELIDKVSAAARLSGDFVWRLPLTDDYKPAVISDVADLCNIGRKEYQAGATIAACFLQHFVDNVPWVHLDIAGTAFNVPDIPYYRKSSATGVGVRLLIELAMDWEKL